MIRKKTNDWLKDIQNRSWEPEILISGITLTLIFILSGKIYNFCAMLIQDYGVFETIAYSVYIISIFLITGFKIILIVHLVFRGLWAGMIGLSYVFPKGVNKKRLPANKKNIKYNKPEEFVIKLEKICSLLFSFVFASIASVFLSIVGLSPIVLLYIFNINLSTARIIANYYGTTLIVLSLLYAILINTIFKKSKFKQKVDNSFFEYLIKIYATNLGKIKTYILFTFFSLIILLFSYQEMLFTFHFKNYKKSKFSTNNELIGLNKDHYESERNQKLRVPKATIQDFHIEDKQLNLFISFYKSDLYTLDKIRQNPEITKKHLPGFDSVQTDITDIYKLMIDDKFIFDSKWYSINHKFTNQKGLITSIPLDSINDGYHELKISKLLWRIKTDSLLYVKNWGIIPFEKLETGNN